MNTPTHQPGRARHRLADGSRSFVRALATAQALWLPAALALPSALLPASPAAAQTAAATMAGDLIVKFRDGSDPGAALAAVLNGQRPLASAAPLAARLSRELGVPLTLVQVTSGREALLAIDREALLRSLAQRAAREPGVTRATPVPPPPGLPPEQASVRIELAAQASPRAIAARMATGELLRPRLHADAGGATLLSYDMAGLTQALRDRIGQRADVDYVQPNRLLRPAGPGGLR